MASRNCERNGVKVLLRRKDVLNAAPEGVFYDVIVSNPPYIPSADIYNLDKEVRLFDPLLALDGGDDGLRDYIRISSLANQMLKKGGYLVFEVGFNQADDVVEIARKNGLQFVKTAKDYNGINRCVILKKTV